MIECPRCSKGNEDGARFCVGCGENLAALGATQEGEPADPYIGKLLEEKFMITDHLGDGGMGKVYEAEQLSLNKTVAVKILHKSLLQNETQVKRFQREAWSASRLDHPHSIGIIDFGKTEDGAAFIVMEHLKGRELADVLQEEFPLGEERLVKILCQVLSVLAEAHENKIIHRDLKPENIMLIKRAEEEDFVKVLDFGIAKLQERDPNQPALTMQGIVCGTPEYMSPEQAMGQDLDNRTDLYSTGCILYEMLTGQVPFVANNYQAILGMHIRDEPTKPSLLCPNINISPALEQVALVALAKDRNQRYPDAIAMKKAIEEALECPSGEAAQSPAQPQAPKGGTMVMSATGQGAPVTAGDIPPESPVSRSTLGGAPAAAETAAPTAAATSVEEDIEEGYEFEATGLGKGKIIGIAAAAVVVLGILGFFIFGGGEPEMKKEQAAAEKMAMEAEKTAQDKKPGETAPQPKEIKPAEKKAEPSPVAKKPIPAAAAVAGSEKEKKKTKTRKKKVASKSKPNREKKLSSVEKQKLALEYYKKGNEAFKKGNASDAIKNYNLSRKYNPRSARVYKKLGMAYMKKGHKKQAQKHFKKYLKLQPNAADASRIKALVDSI